MDNLLEPNSQEEVSASEVPTSSGFSSTSTAEDSPNRQLASSDNGGELQDLGVNFVDQNVLERELMAKV
jgi:hypothetical protein